MYLLGEILTEATKDMNIIVNIFVKKKHNDLGAGSRDFPLGSFSSEKSQ